MRIFTALTGVAGLLASAALVAASPQAVAAEVVPAEHAGAVEIFGVKLSGGVVRQSYPAVGGPQGPWRGVSQGMNDLYFYGIRADGELESVLTSPNSALAVPPLLAGESVVSVSQSASMAGAVTDEGVPHLWGAFAANYPLPSSESALGGKAIQIVVGSTFAAVLLDTGKIGVVTNGGTYGVIGALSGGVEIEGVTGSNVLVVRLAGGGAVQWDVLASTQTAPPAEVATALATDPLADIAVGIGRVAGVTESGAVYTWGLDGSALPATDVFPAAEVTAGRVVEVAATSSANAGYLARTNKGQLISWAATSRAADMKTTAATLSNPGNVRIAAGQYYFRVITDPDPDLQVLTSPAIAGTPEVGETLTGTAATFNLDDATLSNQWLADGEAIAGAAGTSLVLTSAQEGKSITFRTTAVQGAQTVPSTSAAVGPVTEPVAALEVDDPPTIAGTPEVGSTLTGTPATFNATDGVTLSNQWLADGSEIASETGTTLVLTSAQVGKQITFRTTAVRGGETVPSTSAAVGPVTEQAVVNPPVPGDTPECQAAKSAASAAQAALGAAQAKATKAKAKLKKAKKAKKPAAKVKKLKKKAKKAKKAQKAAASASATASANVTAKCS